MIRSALRRTPLKPARRRTGPTAKVTALVKARDGGCIICGTQTVDLQHRRARAMGGTSSPAANKPSNLVSLCRAHHHLVETDPLWMARGTAKGWRVRQSADPRFVRCWVLGWGPVFLLDDGAISACPPPGFTPQGNAA